MKHFYIAIQTENNGKWYAHAWSVSESDNIVSILEKLNAKIATICSTKKAAFELVEIWRARFIENGVYMFQDEPSF